MSTATRQQKDPVAKLAPIEEQLQAAREERARLGVEYRAWQTGIAELEATYSNLAQEDAAQFAHGFPRPKTKAAELRAEIDKRANGHKWSDILSGADRRIQDLEHDLSRRTEANAEELSRAEFEGAGKAAVEKMKQGAALIAEGYSEYLGSSQRQMAFCIATQGLDGRDVLSDQRAAEIARQAAKLGDLAPPRSGSLTPLASEEVPRMWRIKSGGFVKSPNPDDLSGVEQPERVSL